MADRPPDLDANGQPAGAKPPDLDATGKPAAGDHYTGPDTFMGGAMQSLGQTAKDTGAAMWEGAKTALDPRNYLAADRSKSAADQRMVDEASGKVPTPHDFTPAKVGAQVTDAAKTLSTPAGGGNAIGQLLTGLLVPKAVNAAGGVLRTVAPSVMDMGLQRTRTDRLDFPNTPKRLVDEGIVPRGANVQNALTATENKINADAARFDAPQLTGPGVPIQQPPADPRTMAQTAQQFATKAGKVPGLGNVPGPEAAELSGLQQNYLAQNTRPRGLQETLDQKRAYQARSNYPSRPNAPTATNNELNFNKGIAGANRAEAIRMQPSMAGDLAKEQDLIGADTALRNLDAKSTPMSTVATLKTALLLRNPTAMGGAAIGLDRLGGGLQSLPALIRAALLARMGHPEHTP